MSVEELLPTHGLIDFDRWFPCLVSTVEQLEQKTDYEYFKISLKFAIDDELSSGTRSFYKTRMSKIVQEVDEELSRVLGQDWTTLKG